MTHGYALEDATRAGDQDRTGNGRRGASRETPLDPALAEALATFAAGDRLSDGDIHRLRAKRRQSLASATVAALAIAVGGGLWSSHVFAPPRVLVAHLETARGEQRNVRLADGSIIRLNGATRLDVRLSDDARTIQLALGEAYFDVAHQPARPFTVSAGGTSTRVLGTAFDVAMNAGSVRVSVYRGRVRFGSADDARSGVLVPAGWRSRYDNGILARPERFDAAAGDWRQGWLDTNHMRLDELVEALNRRGGPVILSPPPGLAGMQLAGRFRLDDARNLLEAIGVANGFSVSQSDDRITLVPAH